MICSLRPDVDSEQFLADLDKLVWGFDTVVAQMYNEFHNHDLTLVPGEKRTVHPQDPSEAKKELQLKEIPSLDSKTANLGFAKLANTDHQSSDVEYQKVLQDTASEIWAHRGIRGLPANATFKVTIALTLYLRVADWHVRPSKKSNDMLTPSN